jgi:membrane-associated phospholipid phosphatase
MPEMLHRLPRNVIAIFSGRNLCWHALAIALTVVIVMSGFDWFYYSSTRAIIFTQLARPAIVLGGLIPIFGTLTVVLVGELGRNRRIITTAWALGQAALLGYFISCGYKAFTGRLPPPHFRVASVVAAGNAALPDASHGFQFGFLKGGVFWGWPSSHTTVAFAMAVCLVTLYPSNRRLVVVALLYTCYVGLSVSVTIHWFSEFAAGAIFGSIIGSVVGKSFRTRLA